jgi:filamentous hemagglutinin
VQSRINLANGRTPFTPVDKNGNRIGAGWEHIRSRHFGGGNSQSQFTIPESSVRQIPAPRP